MHTDYDIINYHFTTKAKKIETGSSSLKICYFQNNKIAERRYIDYIKIYTLWKNGIKLFEFVFEDEKLTNIYIHEKSKLIIDYDFQFVIKYTTNVTSKDMIKEYDNFRFYFRYDSNIIEFTNLENYLNKVI